MRQTGLQPNRDAVALIADRVEGNLLAAGQEIEKLRLLLGEGKVTAEDVNKAVANSSRYDVYKLTDAAIAGDAPRAVKILGGLKAEGVEPVIVMWALTRELPCGREQILAAPCRPPASGTIVRDLCAAASAVTGTEIFIVC